jgi:hypothetical protein
MKHPGIILIFLFGSCVSHEFPIYIDCSTTSMSFKINSIVPATDCTLADGSVMLNAKGGKKPYAFSVDGITWSADSNFHNLASGDYTFYLKDANGCALQVDSIITRAEEFPGLISATADTECLENNGSIQVELDGDTSGFLFRIDNEDFSQVPQFNGLAEGAHTLYIRSGNGCTTINSVNVPRAFTGVSWTNEILPIMIASCAISGCHDGVSRLDWRNYNQVKLYAQQIKRRTRDRSMPFDNTLPQDQIDKISCWVDDGAPNN